MAKTAIAGINKRIRNQERQAAALEKKLEAKKAKEAALKQLDNATKKTLDLKKKLK